jgi:hypothetical protein
VGNLTRAERMLLGLRCAATHGVALRGVLHRDRSVAVRAGDQAAAACSDQGASGLKRGIGDALAMPCLVDIDFVPPKADFRIDVADLE